MKKRQARLLCILLCLLAAITGCSVPERYQESFTGEGQGTAGRNGEDPEAEDTGGTAVYGSTEVLCRNIRGITEAELADLRALGIDDGTVADQRQAQKGLYYYDALSEEQQFLYAQLLMILERQGMDIIISETEEECLDPVFQAVLADHPEIFYVTGYTYTKHLLDGEVQRISFCGDYTMNADEIEAAQKEIDRYVQDCMDGMPRGDDYVKVRYLYEYVINHTDYSLDAPENQNICSVFLYGQSVCLGYARAFEYLCRQCGVEATLVNGAIRESGYGHAWNLVRINGEWYYVDVTWGDASYTSDGSGKVQDSPGVNYDYLCITTKLIEKTHEISTVVRMPECSATADNYYVRENAYFTELDPDGLENLFGKGRTGEDGYVAFGCASGEVFQEYYEYLITGQKVFEYMDSETGIAYSCNPDAYTFSFWTTN